MKDHPSDFTWTKYLVGELSGREERQLRDHLKHCAECQREHDAMLAEQKSFLAAPERKRELAVLKQQERIKHVARESLKERPFFKAWFLAVPVAAACAIALFLVYTVQQTPEPDSVSVSGSGVGSAIRIKGNNTLVIYAKRDGKVSTLEDICHPGDNLRARFWTDKKYVFILGNDGAESDFYPLYPMEKTVSREVKENPTETPDSWVLDESLGVQHIVAVFSDKPLPFDEAVQSFRLTKAGGIVANDNKISLAAFQCQKRP